MYKTRKLYKIFTIIQDADTTRNNMIVDTRISMYHLKNRLMEIGLKIYNQLRANSHEGNGSHTFKC